ncbi:cold-shock protein [Pseudomonas proteolytica]|uniref:cold-shock protein n=1 Tax=Pseudomonas proteolytica TaxID=219574 RepID=UPI0014739F4C|nr:cold shock domain-containing protein [Pseudomonas proteolytica]NMZ10241.1 cold-shock protein [Pseudomonas proteolytica]
MATGTVKWFNETRGIGSMVLDDGGGAELFVEFAAIQVEERAPLKEGQRVQFDIVEGPKGKQAAGVRPL